MEKSEKEYGKLSLDQFKRIIDELPEIRKQIQEVPELVKSAQKVKIDEILGDGICWANVYEMPFDEQIALLICAMGRAKALHEAAQSKDPVQAAIDTFMTDEFEYWDGGEGGIFSMRDIVGLTIALQRNILSIMLFHRTLDKLVDETKAGDDSSLFKAIRIDHSIVACDTFAARISRAELEGDKLFFRHFRSALKGPSKKHWEAYKDLRYALCILRESGFNTMSDAQLEDLLVYKLKLYSNTPGARKNLRKQFTESKKFSTT